MKFYKSYNGTSITIIIPIIIQSSLVMADYDWMDYSHRVMSMSRCDVSRCDAIVTVFCANHIVCDAMRCDNNIFNFSRNVRT